MRLVLIVTSIFAANCGAATLQEKLDQFRKCREGAPALTNGPVYVDSLTNRRTGKDAVEIGFILDNLGQTGGTCYVVKGDKSVAFDYANFKAKAPQSWQIPLSKSAPPPYVFASRTEVGSRSLGTLKHMLSVSLSDTPHPEAAGQRVTLRKANSEEVLTLVRKGLLDSIERNVKDEREIARKLAEGYSASTADSRAAVSDVNPKYTDKKSEAKKKAARLDLKQASQMMAESGVEDMQKELGTLDACKKVDDDAFRTAVEKIQKGG